MFDNHPQRPQYSTWTQLSILLMLTGVGFLIGGFVSLGIAASYLNVPFEKLPDAFKNANDANLARLLQFISTFFFMALPAFVFARINDRKAFKYLGFNSALSGKQVFIIVGIVFLSLIISGILSQVNAMIPLTKRAEQYFKSLEDNYNKQVSAIANMKTAKDYIISLIMIALLPAIFEEMLFRGALQPLMINLSKNSFIGILITSILFSAIHLSYYGFLPRVALGLIIGYIFYFSKNLWLASATHFFYNAFGVTQIYALSKRGILTQEAMKDDTFPLYFALFAAGALYIIFIFFKKECDVVLADFTWRNKNDGEENYR
jgi:membrane protease YdiL (CAAX protease family)